MENIGSGGPQAPRELSSEYFSLDLLNGKATSLMGLSDNEISTNSYLSDNIFLRLLLKFLNPCPLTLVLTIITLNLLPDAEAYPRLMYQVEVGLVCSLIIIKEIYFDRMRAQADAKVNKSKFAMVESWVRRAEKLIEGENGQPITWGQIRQGDVVYLQKGERVPADIIVLDTQHIEDRDSVVYVDSQSISGSIIVERKKACELTKITSRSATKRNWEKYSKDYLNGRVKYELPNSVMGQFIGYMKLIKDPKTCRITSQNFISRESTIKTCWIIGLVVYAGMNCKIMRHISQRKRNQPFKMSLIDWIFLVAAGLNLLLAIIFYLLAQNDVTMAILVAPAYFALLFSLLLPHFLHISNSLLHLYFSLAHSTQTQKAQITDDSCLPHLGSIDYALVAHNGVLSSGRLHVDEIVTASSIYYFKDQAQTLQRKARRTGSSGIPLPGSELKDSKNKRNQKFFQNIANVVVRSDQETFFLDDDSRQQTQGRMLVGTLPGGAKRVQLEPLRISREKLENNVANGEDQASGLVRAFAFCHQAILKPKGSDDLLFEANSRLQSEEVILKLVNSVGVCVSSHISTQSKKDMGLKLKIGSGNEIQFHRKINSFQIQRKIFSVMVKDEAIDQRIIYVKGRPQDMLEKLRDKELKKNILEDRVKSFQDSKSEVIIYGKRTIPSEEYESYDSQFTKLKVATTVTPKDLEDFSSRFEKDLQFVCMVGLSTQKSEPAKQFIQYLTSQGIKLCLFTNGVDQLKALKALLQETELKSPRQKDPKGTLQEGNRVVDYIDLEGSVQELRYNLNSVTRKLRDDKGHRYYFSLVLSRAGWDLLRAHSNLMQHFLFTAYYSQALFAYSFGPEAKAELAKRFKYGYNREHILMTVGSSYSDLLFETYADVSMTLTSEDQNAHSDIPSDIRAPNVLALREFLDLGSWISHANSQLMHATIYRSMLIGTVTLTLQAFLLFYNTTKPINGNLVCFYIVVYGIIQTLFVLLSSRKIQPLPELKNKKVGLLRPIIEGAIHGVTIGLGVLFTLPNARLDGGKIFPVQAIHFSFYFLMITVSIFRHLLTQKTRILGVVLLAVISYISTFGGAWLYTIVHPEFSRYAIQMALLWQSYDSVIMLVNCTVFCLACSLFLREAGRLEQFGKYEGKASLSRIDLVKHLFREEDQIQQSIQEAVGVQFDTNQLKIGFNLQIKKAEHRIKNQYNNAKLNSSRFKLTLSLLIIFLTVLAVQAFLNQVFLPYLIPLLAALLVILFVLAWLFREGEALGRIYYRVAEVTMVWVFGCILLYESFQVWTYKAFLLSSLLCVISTQLLDLRLVATGLLLGFAAIVGSVCGALGTGNPLQWGLQILLLLGCAGANLRTLYGSVLQSRKNFILRQQIEMQTNQTNDIWTILVPQFVRNFFGEQGQQGRQYRENSVAILFCYICNFDAMIEEEERNVVRMLDDLYRQFDRLCSNYAVQKIETVGYTYMAATGIKKIEENMEHQMVRRNKVERLLAMSLQMLQKARSFKWGTKKDKELQIKIAIHVGEVVVGVIGKHKKQFSLIGTNVNATSRHGSTGENGSITFSREARAQLPNYSQSSFTQKKYYMKGLSKNNDDLIPVFVYKPEEAGKRTHPRNTLRTRFKQLIMKIIHTHRLDNQSSIDEDRIQTQNFIQVGPVEAQPQQNGGRSVREIGRRTTCRGLENNFNKIEKMKNREDELKFYNILLEFNEQKLLDYYREGEPYHSQEQIEIKLIQQQQIAKEYVIALWRNNRGLGDSSFVLFLFVLNLVFLSMNIGFGGWSYTQIVVRLIGIIFTLLMLMFQVVRKRGILIDLFSVGLYACLIGWEKSDQIGGQNGSSSLQSFSHFYGMMIATLYSGLSGMRFSRLVTVVLIGATAQVIAIILQYLAGRLQIMSSFYELFYLLFVLVRKYQIQKESMINFRQGRQTAQISNQLSKIVSQLLPKHAYQKLKNQNFENRLQLTDRFQQCTILYADIKGFTQFSNKPQNKSQPQNVVKMLKSLFQQFDVLCLEKQVYKVYTIGDCYVVLGFTNCYDRNPYKEALNVVDFALNMLRKIDEVKKDRPNLECLNMRIGIHTGTIIGGIVGTDIVRYDIYGHDVIVANKFEQHGRPGQIHISEETKKLLDHQEAKKLLNQSSVKLYSQNDISPGEKVEIKRINMSYNGYFIKRSSL